MVRVERGAIELTGENRKRRIPVMAVADEERVEALAIDVPAAALQAGCMLDGGVEADVLPEAEAVCVLVQELVDLGVVGEVGIALVHREVGEADGVARGVDVQRAVRRRAAIGVAEVPVAADVIRGLKAGVRDLPVA